MSENNRGILDFLNDIIREINDIEEHFPGAANIEHLSKDRWTLKAVVKSLENISEASKRIPKNIKDQYPTISWKNIIGMRNRIVHEYFAIDTEIVSDVIENDIFPLKIAVLEIIDKTNAQPELFSTSKDKERFAELVEAVKDADFRFVRMKLMLIKQNEGAEYLVNFMKQKTPENMTLVQLAKRGKFEDPDVERQEVLGKMVDLLERVAESGEIKTDAASSEVSQHADTSVDGTLDPSGKL